MQKSLFIRLLFVCLFVWRSSILFPLIFAMPSQFLIWGINRLSQFCLQFQRSKTSNLSIQFNCGHHNKVRSFVVFPCSCVKIITNFPEQAAHQAPVLTLILMFIHDYSKLSLLVDKNTDTCCALHPGSVVLIKMFSNSLIIH